MQLSKEGQRRPCSLAPTQDLPHQGQAWSLNSAQTHSGRMDSFISKSGGHRLPASCPVFGLLSTLLHKTWAGGKKRETGPKAKDS